MSDAKIAEFNSWSTNTLTSSPHYQSILKEIAERVEQDGKLNSKKFYTEVIEPRIPNYSLYAFYYFMRRF